MIRKAYEPRISKNVSRFREAEVSYYTKRGNESSYCREIVLWMNFNDEINFNTILTIIEDL